MVKYDTVSMRINCEQYHAQNFNVPPARRINHDRCETGQSKIGFLLSDYNISRASIYFPLSSRSHRSHYPRFETERPRGNERGITGSHLPTVCVYSPGEDINREIYEIFRAEIRRNAAFHARPSFMR